MAMMRIPKKKKYNCNICKKSFDRDEYLKRHKRSIHRGTKPKNTYYICKAEFREKGNLAKHVAAVHMGQKNFGCRNCDKKFVTKSGLHRHETQIHLSSNEKQTYKCGKCKKTYHRKDHLKRHEITKNHH